MPSEDSWFKIDESKPKNAYLLKFMKENKKSVRRLAKDMNIPAPYISEALNKKDVAKHIKIKIARYFNVDSCEIFG